VTQQTNRLNTARLNTALDDRYRILRHLGEGGMASVYLCEEIKTDGYTPILHGNRYIQMVGWHADGTVDPCGILTYSQSVNPATPFCADPTRLYSKGQWLRCRFM
jgi:acyl-homoserine-lactone acylase